MMAHATSLNAGNSGNNRRATVARVLGKGKGTAGPTGKPVSTSPRISGDGHTRNNQGRFCRNSGSLGLPDAATVATVATERVGESDSFNLGISQDDTARPQVTVGKSDSASMGNSHTAPFTSVFALAREAHRMSDRYPALDEAIIASDDRSAARERWQMEMDELYARQNGLHALAQSYPARTLADAAAHIGHAMQLYEDARNNHLDECDALVNCEQFRRCLGTALAVVADAAGVTVADVAGVWGVTMVARFTLNLGDRP